MEDENKTFNSLSEILDYTKDYPTIMDCFIKASNIIEKFKKPVCSISGGKDSDIMLDIMTKVDTQHKVIYVWLDTGIEYQATKNHLDYLEQRYGIKIHRERAIKPIPAACKEYGYPFVSKHISEMMYRLQKHNFKWEDESFETLISKYPKCKSALQWWTNHKQDTNKGYSQFNINYNKYLKEYIVLNPPKFKISSKCCDYAKKKVAHNYENSNNCDLSIIGIRKSEGGVRTVAYKNCFSENDNKISQYRPLFWFTDEDERNYENLFNIVHSDCYTIYGLKRTGCVGCPYGKELSNEIAIMEQYEPKLAKAANNIFKDSYEYTKKYRQFVTDMKADKGGDSIAKND